MPLITNDNRISILRGIKRNCVLYQYVCVLVALVDETLDPCANIQIYLKTQMPLRILNWQVQNTRKSNRVENSLFSGQKTVYACRNVEHSKSRHNEHQQISCLEAIFIYSLVLTIILYWCIPSKSLFDFFLRVKTMNNSLTINRTFHTWFLLCILLFALLR